MIITRTPFRISFFGGGTDYPAWYKENGGAVLSATIDKYCYISVRYHPPFFPFKHRVVWSKIENVNSGDEIEHPSVRATLAHLCIEEGVEVHHSADLPARSGLGASSSFTVGLLRALYALRNKEISQKQLALEAIHVEQNVIKENVGAQDQTAAAFGGLNKICFGGNDVVVVESVNLPEERKRALEDRLLLFFTGVARSASDVAAEQIKNIPKKETELKAMRALVDEGEKILKNSKSDIDDFGRLLHEGWQIKRGFSSQITNPFIDGVYKKGMSAGALGGKLLGAGAGGFMAFYVPPEKQDAVKSTLKEFLYVPIKFTNEGSRIIYNANQDTRLS